MASARYACLGGIYELKQGAVVPCQIFGLTPPSPHS